MSDAAIFVIGLVVSGLVAVYLVMAFVAMLHDPHEDWSDPRRAASSLRSTGTEATASHLHHVPELTAARSHRPYGGA